MFEDPSGMKFVDKFKDDGVYILSEDFSTDEDDLRHSAVLVIWTDEKTGKRMFYFTELKGQRNNENTFLALTVGMDNYKSTTPTRGGGLLYRPIRALVTAKVSFAPFDDQAYPGF